MQKPITKVTGKNFSPFILRKYSMPELLFVALITDDDLDNLDDVINEFILKNTPFPNSIQEMRNLAGELSEVLKDAYPKSEGVGVIFQADKMTISSLAGDFMNHTACRIELYGLLNFTTGV